MPIAALQKGIDADLRAIIGKDRTRLNICAGAVTDGSDPDLDPAWIVGAIMIIVSALVALTLYRWVTRRLARLAVPLISAANHRSRERW